MIWTILADIKLVMPSPFTTFILTAEFLLETDCLSGAGAGEVGEVCLGIVRLKNLSTPSLCKECGEISET